MNELTLEWIEAGEKKQYAISDRNPGKQAGVIRLGRDPARCDLVFSEPTVSGLHVELFFDAEHHCVYLRNLRDTNPPTVNGQKVTQTAISLNQGSTITLGRLTLQVVHLSLETASIPPTILMSPERSESPIGSHPTPPHPGSNPDSTYGLVCPQCHKPSTYDRLDLGCPWCGTSLAGAVSVLIATHGKKS